MNAKNFTVVLFLLFALQGFAIPTFTIADRQAITGETICVDVQVKDFVNISKMEFTLHLPGVAYEFLNFQNFKLPELNESNFERTGDFLENFETSWTAANGVTLPNNTSLFQVCFKLRMDCREFPVTLDSFFISTPSAPTTNIGAEFIGGKILNLNCYIVNQCFTMALSTASGVPGDTVCIDLTADEFKEVAYTRFSLGFDTQKLKFLSVQNFNSLAVSSQAVDTAQASNGKIAVSWDSLLFNTQLTRPDGVRIFTVCFLITGNLGDSTTVQFTDDPNPIEIRRRFDKKLTYNLLPGKIYFQTGDSTRLEARASCVEPAGCKAPNDGKIELVVTGGRRFYTFQWSGPNGFTSNKEDLENLAPGIYSAIVTDRDGRSAVTGPIEIGIQSNFIQITTPDTTLCATDTLVLKTTATESLTHIWSSKLGKVVFDCKDIHCPNPALTTSPLIAGVQAYQDVIQVIATNTKGCQDTASVAVETRIYSNVFSQQNISVCTNEPLVLNKNNQLEVEGIFDWQGPNGLTSTAPTIQLENPIPSQAGRYILNYQDPKGCQLETTFNVNVITDIPRILSVTPSPDTICTGMSSSALIKLPFSESPYTVNWANGKEERTQDSVYGSYLYGGTQQVVVTNSKGCSVDTTFTIPVFELIEATVTTTSSCGVPNGGTATVNILSGRPPFSYSWSNPSTTSIATGLPPGQQQVFITDGNGCTQRIDTINISGTFITRRPSSFVFISLPNTAFLEVETRHGNSVSWEPIGQYDVSFGRIIPQPINNITNYVYTVSDGQGCVLKDSVLVIVYPDTDVSSEFASIEIGDTLQWCYTPPVGNPADYYINQVVFTGTLNPVKVKIEDGTVCLDYWNAGTEFYETDSLFIEICPKQGGPCTLVGANVNAIEVLVYPGDTNDDGEVNHLDLLNIGIGNGTTGFDRGTGTDQEWYGWAARLWGQYTPGIRLNYAHIDADGNGTILPNDTSVIKRFWGNTHAYANLQTPTFEPRGIGTPLFIDVDTLRRGQTIRLPIVLGDATTPAQNAYGTAFTIQYDPTIIDTASVSLDFTNSWLGVENQDFISLYKNFGTQGKIEAAITRLNQQNVSGAGVIGYLNLKVREDVTGAPKVQFSIQAPVLISAQEIVIPVAPLTTEANLTTATYEPWLDRKITLFPNPTKDVLHIRASDVTVEKVILYHVNGQIALENAMGTSVSTESLQAGVYLCKIWTDKGMVTKRIAVVR